MAGWNRGRIHSKRHIDFEFGLCVFGTARLYVDDELLIDNETEQRGGGSFFNVGIVEETGIKSVVAGSHTASKLFSLVALLPKSRALTESCPLVAAECALAAPESSTRTRRSKRLSSLQIL